MIETHITRLRMFRSDVWSGVATRHAADHANNKPTLHDCLDFGMTALEKVEIYDVYLLTLFHDCSLLIPGLVDAIRTF